MAAETPGSDPPAELVALDTRLVAAVRGIRLLGALSWPQGEQLRFLDAWRRGRPRLPAPEYAVPDQAAIVAELDVIARDAPLSHPYGAYLAATARSYAGACRLLAAAGTPDMTRWSLDLYGRPGDPLPGGEVDNLDAARHFIAVSRDFETGPLDAPEAQLTPEALAEVLTARMREVFGDDPIPVVVDPGLVSRAAASGTRLRLRGGIAFQPADVEQLLQHEAFVHGLTARNGRAQHAFGALALGAPRTTGTQEGLATFAELVTGAIDVHRLERTALRIIAIDRALDGADFIEVFALFIEAGQGEVESFRSAMRVFRGAPLTGGHAFTKDVVYLHGLLEVHTFFGWCLREGRLGLARHLMAGRMTVDDVLVLEPLFEAGLLDAPRWLPPWLTRGSMLAGYLAFAVFASNIHLPGLSAQHPFALPERGAAGTARKVPDGPLGRATGLD